MQFLRLRFRLVWASAIRRSRAALQYAWAGCFARYLTTTRAHCKMGGMNRKPVASKLLLPLMVAGLVLPISICIVVGSASLLAAMGDALGGAVLRYVALAGGVVWILVLIGLILVQAAHALASSDDADP